MRESSDVSHDDLAKQLNSLVDGIKLAFKHAAASSSENESEDAANLRKSIWAGFLSDLVSKLEAVVNDTHLHKIDAKPFNPMQLLWKSVIGRAKKSIWTTNVRHPRESFGRVSDNSLLSLQKSAIDEGIEIVRVFVYDKVSQMDYTVSSRNLLTSGDLFDLRDVINDQLHRGIKLFAISKKAFDEIKGPTQYLGTDFMIVDELFVYTTVIPKAADEQVSSHLLTNEKYLKDACRARDRIMESRSLIAIETPLDTCKIFDS